MSSSTMRPTFADIRRGCTTRTRLAGAEENLLRCRAVIAELEPHVQRLRAQADRAERAQVLRAELAALAGRWLRHALAGAQDRPRPGPARGIARQKSEQQDAELADLERLARDAEAVSTAAENTVAGLEPRLAAARDEVAKVGRELARAEERLSGADDAEARLLAELERQREREAALSPVNVNRCSLSARPPVPHSVRPSRQSWRRRTPDRVRRGRCAPSRRRSSPLHGAGSVHARRRVWSAAAALEEARGRIERMERRHARLGEDIERSRAIGAFCPRPPSAPPLLRPPPLP